MRVRLVRFCKVFGGATQSRTGLNGFAIRCITALLSRHIQIVQRCELPAALSPINPREKRLSGESGAGDESRTRDLNLGKVALYQLSYSRVQQAGNNILSLQKVKAFTFDLPVEKARPCAGNTPSTIASERPPHAPGRSRRAENPGPVAAHQRGAEGSQPSGQRS
jgi:hypothetical protein